ncbi:MAG: hypothetical protein K8953_08290, partial [Proteobacteria bacterium]|nr:hypothetical protein [Pseudomonadota bacterium]
MHDIFVEMETYARTGHIPVVNPPRIAIIGSDGHKRDRVIEAFLRWRPYGSGRIWDEKNRIYAMQ